MNFDQKKFSTSHQNVKIYYENKIYFLILRLNQGSDELFVTYALSFTGPKMFCSGLHFLSQPKNLTAFSASSKTFVPAQKPILRNANHLFVWHKKFGPAQNILGPVKRTRH